MGVGGTAVWETGRGVLINRAQSGLKGGGPCWAGAAGLGSRGAGTRLGCLPPVLHGLDGGFAEEAVLAVH